MCVNRFPSFVGWGEADNSASRPLLKARFRKQPVAAAARSRPGRYGKLDTARFHVVESVSVVIALGAFKSNQVKRGFQRGHLTGTAR